MSMPEQFLCPFCQCAEVHLQDVEINRGGELTCVDRTGTRVKAGEPSGRGARIEIGLWCENHHQWHRSFQFCKGTLSVQDELLIDGCPGCMEAYARDLWRD